MSVRILACLVGVIVGSVLSSALPVLAQFAHDLVRVERDPMVAELDNLAKDAELLAAKFSTGDYNVRRAASTLGPRLRKLTQMLRTAPSDGRVQPGATADDTWEREFGQRRRRESSDAHSSGSSRGRSDHRDHGARGHRCNACPGAAMGPADFALLLAEYDRTMLSHRREALLEVAAQDSYFYTEQVGALMERSTFDRDRLAVAIKLAPRLVDPARAYTLADKLTFFHSRDELYRELSIARRPGPY